MNVLATAEITINKGHIIIRKPNVNEDQCKEDVEHESSTMIVENADIPETYHITNKHIAEEVRNLVAQYKPTKINESPVSLRITLLNEIPIFQQPRRLPPKEKIFVQKQVDEWLEMGIIKPSFSDYASPIVLAKKKDGSLRLCIDYRELNRKVHKDRYPLPIIEDCIDKLYNANYFTTLDLANGFFHVSVSEESTKYTAFVTPNGHYEFLKMPFGFCNSPSTFQRFIAAIFRPLVAAEKILIYIDDIIIPSITEEEGYTKLKEVLQIASECNLEIRWKKCKLLQTEIEYLGHIISRGNIKTSPHKTKAVLNFPEPKNYRQLQSFLGLAGYFRKFIKNFAIMARPLSDLLKKDTTFAFNDEQRQALQTIKELLSKDPVLKIFRPGATTELHTDACMYGYGAVLLQINQEDNLFHIRKGIVWRTISST